MSAALIGLAAFVALVAWVARQVRGRGRNPVDPDAVDAAELEAAEREVRDLDITARPDDGFEGDDWGPGAGGGAPRR